MTKTHSQREKQDFVESNDPNYVEKALTRLRERGLATEMAVAHEAHTLGWRVSMSEWYDDPDQNVPREIDVVAATERVVPLRRPETPRGRVELASAALSLVMEVKSASDGWAVVPASAKEMPQHPGNERYIDYFEERSYIHQDFNEGLTHTIHSNQEWLGARVTEIFSSSDKGSAFAGMLQCAAATRARVLQAIRRDSFGRAIETVSASDPPFYRAWHAVLVHGGRLFKVVLGSKFRLEEIKWAPVLCRWAKHPQIVQRDRCLVDVVAISALSEYLTFMRKRADVIMESFEAALVKHMSDHAAVRAPDDPAYRLRVF